MFQSVLENPFSSVEIVHYHAQQDIFNSGQMLCHRGSGCCTVPVGKGKWKHTHTALRDMRITQGNGIIVIIGLPNMPCNWGHVWHGIESAKFWGPFQAWPGGSSFCLGYYTNKSLMSCKTLPDDSNWWWEAKQRCITKIE